MHIFSNDLNQTQRASNSEAQSSHDTAGVVGGVCHR